MSTDNACLCQGIFQGVETRDFPLFGSDGAATPEVRIHDVVSNFSLLDTWALATPRELRDFRRIAPDVFEPL